MVPPTYDPKPATLTTIQWEDEKTFCYLVEIKGISVGRRKDNNMINGTKLLNLSGMTRGKRDGILKSELERSVIKSGLMVLKGVWITFERAKELAKEYGIHDMLHPLLEWDIESHYYRPILDVGPQHPLSNEHRWGMPLTTTVKPLHPPKLSLPLHSLPPMTSMVTSAAAVPPMPIPFSQPAAPPQWNNISYASVPPMAQAQPIHMPRSSNSPTISSPILNETMVTAATYAQAPPPSEHFMSPPSYSPAPFQWDPSSAMYPTSSAGGPYSDTIVPVSNYSNIDYDKDPYSHAQMTSQNHH
jgi:hypothetical protein